MARFFVLNKCCCCIDLRKATLFYAILSLIIGIIALGSSGVAFKLLGSAFKRMDSNARGASGLRYSLLMLGINILLLFADVWITMDLIYGIHLEKREKFKRYVWASFVVYGLRLMLLSCVANRLCNNYEDYKWLIISCSALSMSIYLYFLVVIRSYYYKTEHQKLNRDEELNPGFEYDNLHS